MSKDKKKGGFFKFIAGVGIGAAAGLLFAPKSGTETRKDFKKYINELLEELKDVDATDVKEAIEAKIYQIKDSIENLDKETVVKVAKQKAAEIQDMADELVDYAIEKGTPVLEQTAATIRTKAIEVTKEVLTKLEKE